MRRMKKKDDDDDHINDYKKTKYNQQLNMI